MLKKYQILALLLALSLVFVSCSKTPKTAETANTTSAETEVEAPAEKTTIVFWNGVGAPENVVLTELVKEYNETNQDNVYVEEVILDWSTLYSKILLDFETGTPPDIMTIQQSGLYQNVDLGILADITDLMPEYGFEKEDFVESAWNGSFIDGKQYAVPFDLHPLALYYNTGLFEEAGLDPANPPATMKEFLSAAQKLTKDTNGDGTTDQYGMGLAYSGGLPFRLWMSLLWQHDGGNVLNEDNTAAAFNTEAGLESLEFLHDLVYTYKVIPEQEQSPDEDFMKGIVGMVISGPWSQFDFNSVDGLEYATAPLPVFYDQEAAWADSHMLALPDTKDETRMAAAMSFARFLSDNSLTWTQKAGHLPVKQSVLESADFKALDKAQAFAETLPNAHYYPSIKNESLVFGRDSNSPFVVLMESTLLNTKTRQEALNEVEIMVNELLSQ
ncbi:MAG: ABC transporter substrate-binding protein [Pelolinea sp.]|jgi:multiple sugar transport system substrate-binding protein|nr:ABC transporter substrate-binding protein [Pelolinea sp.]